MNLKESFKILKSNGYLVENTTSLLFSKSKKPKKIFEIIKYIIDNGGTVYNSDVCHKFFNDNTNNIIGFKQANDEYFIFQKVGREIKISISPLGMKAYEDACKLIGVQSNTPIKTKEITKEQPKQHNGMKSIFAFNCENIKFPKVINVYEDLAYLAEEFSGADGDNIKEIYNEACEFNCVEELNIKMRGITKIFIEKTQKERTVFVYDVFGYRVWQKIDNETIYERIWHVEKL